MPALSLPGQTASSSHSHSCPCRQANASIPFWALGQSIPSLWGMGKHHSPLVSPPLPPPPGARPLAWPAWHSLWLETNGGEEGVSKVVKEEADVV